MLRKVFTLIAAFAMTLGMVISAPVVHAEEQAEQPTEETVEEQTELLSEQTTEEPVAAQAEDIVYPVAGIGNGNNKMLIKPGDTLNLDEVFAKYIRPAGATIDERTVSYTLDGNYWDALVLDGRFVTAEKEGSCSITAHFLNEVVDEETGSITAIVTLQVAVAEEVTAFRYVEDSASYVFDPEKPDHTVYGTSLETEPSCALQGISNDEIEYSTSDASIAHFEMKDSRWQLVAEKTGDVTVYAKYKDFTASYQLHIYEEKPATAINCEDEFVTYVGYSPLFYFNYGDEEAGETKLEIVEGSEYISTSAGNTVYDFFPIKGIAAGEAVIRLTSVNNPEVTKDVKVTVIDGAPDLKDNFYFEVYSFNGSGSLFNKNNWTLLPESDHYDLIYGEKYMFRLGTKYGSGGITGESFDPPYTAKGGFTDETGGAGIFVIDTKEAYEFKFPAYPITFNVVERIEDTKAEVSDTVSKEDAAVITKTLGKAEVTSVIDTIKPEAKKALIEELTKGIDTEGKEVSLTVINTVKVTAADLKSEKKSITYEISPKAVVTVDGVAVKTADLKNDQLTGNKDIEVTLPINGLDLKEIVHKSEGYDPEYIYDFVISKEGTVTFKISHFSSFTLNEVITKPVDPSKGTVGTVSPNTGDHTDIILYGGLGIVAMIGAIALIAFRRKHA